MNKKAVILLALLLSSCQSLNSRGVYIDDAKISQLKSQKITKEQLVTYIGQPTLIPDYSPNKWYYISRTLRNKPWAIPALDKQRVIEVTFNGDIMQDIEVRDSVRQHSVPSVFDKTATHGTEENPVQTFVKNFGRFNKTARVKRR